MARNRFVIILILLLYAAGLVAVTLPPPEERARQGAAHHAQALRTTDPSGDLADLRPLGRMVGDAKVVGLGEATHSSHEFFTLKHRVLRYLVEAKGFRAFALEAAWSTGLRLDTYVRTGKGDPHRIMREEFQDTYAWWDTKEYLALVEWLRGWNTRHPQDQVRFLGDDFAYAGPELYDRVLRYAALHQPRLLPRLTELYRGLRPTTSSGTYMKNYLTSSLPERRALATRTSSALALLTRHAPSSDTAEEARSWALQHARAIDQTARGYAFDFADPADLRASMGYRDQLMADNVAWWQERTGDKILLSAHNSHLAYRSSDPRYPRMQGASLRDKFGTAYLSAAMTFGTGSFNATGPDGATTLHTVHAAAQNTTEHFLNSVTPTDYYLDLRTAPAPTSTWLSTPRPIRNIGTAYPESPQKVALARSHDVVVHLQRVTGAVLLATPK
ncbi:erythromycin esterase family protein [Streptomyces sp. NPDC094437]|uniref:erythromycin esterase family protein n=1 Tax=Streptomyces sp. NPDC094437 TaxID=3366060 RepID=UPI0037FAFF03